MDKFINRKDIEKLSRKYVFVCEKHFETKYLFLAKNRTLLLMHLTICLFPLYFKGFKRISLHKFFLKLTTSGDFALKKDLPKQKEPLSKLKDDDRNNSF